MIRMRMKIQVNRVNKEDEMMTNRLASFLSEEGMIKLHHLERMQNHVFYVRTADRKEFALKRHTSEKRVLQQWNFLEKSSSTVAVPFERFPNQKLYLYADGHYWTLSPYITGRKLNYKYHIDRKVALNTLQLFHNETKGIQIHQGIVAETLFSRWHRRLQKFEQTESLFTKYGYGALFKTMMQTATNNLHQLSLFSVWRHLHWTAKQSGQWVHGDVASHNFIQHSDRTYMIDFDLLACAPHLYDYIQLGQRFLPYLEWNLSRLISFNMVKEEHVKPWLCAISVPSDAMREWLHYLSGRSRKTIPDFLATMDKEWEKRQTFLKNAQRMIRL
ncbi:hypothetical protein EU245_01110 [Lentibacillus lipolyticus]|nr:hypothetical protein EU245_01110 [Lentibacillus lipolyticus]